MPRVTDEHRNAMRLRIQNAALECFGRKGFTGASMADIIKEADLSAGAVYVYYSSKAELTIDVGRRIMSERAGALDDFSSAEVIPPPSRVFSQLLASLVDDNPFAPLVLQVWGEATHNAEFATIAQQIFAELIGHFESYLAAYFGRVHELSDEAAQSRAVEMAPAVLALMQGSIVQVSIFGRESLDRVSLAIESVLRGVEGDKG
ncbi:TetR/AcrR family transcriptional regulator [Brevibacterium sp. ZH18]|uniref:TetR/AcrR family transcriptional regulator n=1 Tax=Brevibacterium sp. ZH18 TaxID=2927784 RepID=UPI001F61E7E7|nr:TetR/AcrR family transcriptional regulator [Brevibacterium sp. ZH18]